MGTVSLELLSWVADTIDGPGRSSKVVLEVQSGAGDTVRSILEGIAARFPRFGQDVYDLRARVLKEPVNVYLNGQPLMAGDWLETLLHEGDAVVLLPLIEGG